MTKEKYYKLSSADIDEKPFIFYQKEPKRYPFLREPYKSYECDECQHFKKDCVEIISEVGLPDDIVIPIKRDLVSTFGMQKIASERFKSFLEEHGAEASFIPVPNNVGYYLLYPKVILDPPEGTPVSEDYCKTPPNPKIPFVLCPPHCSSCDAQAFDTFPEYTKPPAETPLWATRLVGEGLISYEIFISNELGLALKKAKFTGIAMRLIEVVK